MNDVTIGVFMARTGPDHPDQMASLARTLKRSVEIQYVYESGTAHQNINKVIDRCKTRYLCLLDDDVIFLDEHWLDHLLARMDERHEIGELVPIEVKTEQIRDEYLSNGWLNLSPRTVEFVEQSWLPGYCALFDMDKTPSLRADEKIPGPSGMSDVDLSLQVRKAGYKCILTNATVVFHRIKPLDMDWRDKWQIIQEYELPALCYEQMTYMTSKWGEFFADAIRKHNLGIL